MNSKLPTLNQEFDATMSDNSNRSLPVSCSLKLPIAGWDGAEVSVSIDHSAMPIAMLNNPFTIKGQDIFRREITMTDVWYRELPTDRPRKTGASQVLLLTIPKISVKDDNGNTSKNTLRLHLGKNDFLRKMPSNKSIYELYGQRDELFHIEIEEIGTVKFLRQWTFSCALNEYETNNICGLQAVVEIDKDKPAVTDMHDFFKDIFLVPSILCRQRIRIHGWEATNCRETVQTWLHPLDPRDSKFMAIEPHKYLVSENHFSSITETAIRTYIKLEKDKKETLAHISIGLAPYVELRQEERFLVMFHALEGCRTFAVDEVPPEISEENSLLTGLLEKVKGDCQPNIALRVEGFISKVNESKLSLLMQLEQVLQKWGVKFDDLWPIGGKNGLKGIRDTLAHKGGLGVDLPALHVATWHLTVLLERIAICLLEIPLEKTEVSIRHLRFEEWYDPQTVRDNQKKVLNTK